MIGCCDVRCVVHGPMRYRPDKYWWNCVGFDGEDCDALFTDEAAHEIAHNDPITDERCLPAMWEYNQYTGMIEVTVGGKECQST